MLSLSQTFTYQEAGSHSKLKGKVGMVRSKRDHWVDNSFLWATEGYTTLRRCFKGEKGALESHTEFIFNTLQDYNFLQLFTFLKQHLQKKKNSTCNKYLVFLKSYYFVILPFLSLLVAILKEELKLHADVSLVITKFQTLYWEIMLLEKYTDSKTLKSKNNKRFL